MARYFSEQEPTFVNALATGDRRGGDSVRAQPAVEPHLRRAGGAARQPLTSTATSFASSTPSSATSGGCRPERSIGSYRPLPNLIWKLLFHLSDKPFSAPPGQRLRPRRERRADRQPDPRRDAAARRRLARGRRLSVCAVLTEAVTGVVGIADVLGGLGVLLALSRLAPELARAARRLLRAADRSLLQRERDRRRAARGLGRAGVRAGLAPDPTRGAVCAHWRRCRLPCWRWSCTRRCARSASPSRCRSSSRSPWPTALPSTGARCTLSCAGSSNRRCLTIRSTIRWSTPTCPTVSRAPCASTFAAWGRCSCPRR